MLSTQVFHDTFVLIYYTPIKVIIYIICSHSIVAQIRWKVGEK